MEEREHLKKFVVGSLPTLIYIPNFTSESEQTQLLHHIYQVPGSKWKSLKNRRLQNWGGVVHGKGLLPQNLPPWLTRITQRIHEQTGLFPSEINHVLINEYLPDQGIMPHQDGPAYFPVVAILSLGSPAVMNFTPHSRLRGNSSDDSNSDKGAVEVNTNEFAEEANSRLSDDHQPFSVLLMPCSLLIFKDTSYSDYLHGIDDTEVHSLDNVVNISETWKYLEEDSSSRPAMEANGVEQHNSICRTGTRVSLTCRLVLKVHKNLFKI